MGCSKHPIELKLHILQLFEEDHYSTANCVKDFY